MHDESLWQRDDGEEEEEKGKIKIKVAKTRKVIYEN